MPTLRLPLLAVAWASFAAHLLAGIGVGKEIALGNPGFASGVLGWSEWSSTGQPAFHASSGPQGGMTVARAALAGGAKAELSQSFVVARSNFDNEMHLPARVGDKLEFGAWVWIANDCTSGSVSLRIASSDGTNTTILAESEPLPAASAPKSHWIYLHTEPVNGTDARVPVGASSCSVVLRDEAQGTVYFDQSQCGRFEYTEYPVVDGNFESDASFGSSWTVTGNAALSIAGSDPDGYYGLRYLELGGAQTASALQTLAIRDGHGSPAPRTSAEACAWILLEGDTLGVSGPVLELSLFAWRQGAVLTPADRVATATLSGAGLERDRWLFVQTDPGSEIGFDRTHLLIEVKKLCAGTVRVDFVQAGERFAVNGNPRTHVACNYVGWFRSPLSGYGSTSPTDPRLLWRNWYWTQPPPCDPFFTTLGHNPDCATSAKCFRPNARRNVAASEDTSSDDLPLAGAYDSRDRDLIRYHVRLAQVIGIDSFVFDHYGRELMRQQLATGIEPLVAESYEALLDVCEEPGVSLKVALMYEPKVHMYEWVSGEPTLADKKAGIVSDLGYLVATYFDRRAVLKRDGGMVIYLFRNSLCSLDGSQCLGDSDWQEIRAAVELTTGKSLCLVADKPPGNVNPFDGASRWQLTSLPLLKYQSFLDVKTQTPAFPVPTAAHLFAHALATQSVATQWANANDAQRFSVPLVWPGFDDSGVAGWGGYNYNGKDGQPLCVRVAHPLNGAFYSTTWNAAFDAGSEWVQIATWNDWNERTAIEPRWSPAYWQAAIAGQPASWTATQDALGRALESQAWIAAFKKRPFERGFSPTDIDLAARAYLRAAALGGGVVQYD